MVLQKTQSKTELTELKVKFKSQNRIKERFRNGGFFHVRRRLLKCSFRRSPIRSGGGGGSTIPASIREDPEGGSLNGCDEMTDGVKPAVPPPPNHAALVSSGGGGNIMRRNTSRAPRLKRQVTIMEDSVSIADSAR